MSGSLVSAGSGVGPSGDPAPSAPVQAGLLQFLGATYNLTPGDNSKYLVCSGGSWTLGLPTPAVGLSYRVRNDQGIIGTTGTITLQPASGAIDGEASISLLPAQECTIYTDGSNWRTFGLKREVVIGSIDITSPVANQMILLPGGYRFFEIDIYNCVATSANAGLYMLLSSNAGSSFVSTGYYDGIIFNSSGTVLGYSYVANGAQARIGGANRSGASDSAQVYVKLWPGDGVRVPSWLGKENNFSGTISNQQIYTYTGNLYGTVIVANALQILHSTGNIAQASIVVKGTI